MPRVTYGHEFLEKFSFIVRTVKLACPSVPVGGWLLSSLISWRMVGWWEMLPE